jgi:hypothetical protein
MSSYILSIVANLNVVQDARTCERVINLFATDRVTGCRSRISGFGHLGLSSDMCGRSGHPLVCEQRKGQLM